MIRRTAAPGGQQVVFVLDAERPVSVVGDFNEWDPHVGAMSAAAGGTCEWSTRLPPGRYAFRYLGEDGAFFDDPEADAYEPNGFGQFHGVLVVPDAPAGEDDASTTARAATRPRARRAAAASSPTAATATSTSRAPRAARPRRRADGTGEGDPSSAARDSAAREPSAEDTAIERRFAAALAAHPFLARADVRGTVHDRVLHLDGEVRSRLGKQALWDLAWSLREVRDVDGRVRIVEHARTVTVVGGPGR
jgi:hypothetical protein